MKIEDLTKLGIAEDVAKQVVTLSEQELAESTKKLTDTEAELQTANESLKTLGDKVKAFDGVDVDKLKADLAESQKKYGEDIAALKLDNAMALALNSSGALDADIVKGLIDRQTVKLGDDGKLLGFTEQLDKLKTDKAFLFKGEDNLSEQPTGARVDTGLLHGGKADDVSTAQARAVMGLPEIK